MQEQLLHRIKAVNMGHLLVAKVISCDVNGSGNLHADLELGTRKEWFRQGLFIPKILIQDLVSERKNLNLDNLLRMEH